MQLHHFTETMEHERFNVVTISFQADYWAKIWLEETASRFPLWFDPDKKLYDLFGLERSYWRSRSFRTLFFYLKEILKGRKIHDSKSDTNQLGGDFVVNAQGILCFSHRSRDPLDRPDSIVLEKKIRTLCNE